MVCAAYVAEHKKRPNFIIGGPEVISIMEDQTHFYYNQSDLSIGSDEDILFIGVLKNRFRIWESIELSGQPYLYIGHINDEELKELKSIGTQKYLKTNKFPVLEITNLGSISRG